MGNALDDSNRERGDDPPVLTTRLAAGATAAALVCTSCGARLTIPPINHWATVGGSPEVGVRAHVMRAMERVSVEHHRKVLEAAVASVTRALTLRLGNAHHGEHVESGPLVARVVDVSTELRIGGVRVHGQVEHGVALIELPKRPADLARVTESLRVVLARFGHLRAPDDRDVIEIAQTACERAAWSDARSVDVSKCLRQWRFEKSY